MTSQDNQYQIPGIYQTQTARTEIKKTAENVHFTVDISICVNIIIHLIVCKRVNSEKESSQNYIQMC